MRLSKIEALTMIERHDSCAVNALKRLYEVHQRIPIFIPADEGFLCSCAEQAFWNQRDRETGRRNVPLLSRKQIAVVRRLLQRYALELTRIANQRASGREESLVIGPTGRTHTWQQRPDCVWCGAQSVTAYDGNPTCQICLDCVISRQPEPSDGGEYVPEQDEIDQLMARHCVKVLDGPAVYTKGGLCIRGRNIRFKTARELSDRRNGMTPEMERELAGAMIYGTDRSAGPVEGDPFEPIGSSLSECP